MLLSLQELPCNFFQSEMFWTLKLNSFRFDTKLYFLCEQCCGFPAIYLFVQFDYNSYEAEVNT